MAETHELRLKIDAAAAKTGSREFVGAVEAVKRAVRDLERDASGAFTSLQKKIKDVSKNGKVKIGVDRQGIRDLNAYAEAHKKITREAANNATSISDLSGKVRGLSDRYRAGKTSAEAYAQSLRTVNTALLRQVQLAGQAAAAAKNLRPLKMTTGPVPAAQAAGAKTMQASVSPDAERSAARLEQLNIAVASALRRATVESERLSRSLRTVGDAEGVRRVNAALGQLRTQLSGGVASQNQLRSAVEGYSQATARARISIVQKGEALQSAARSATAAAAAEAKAASDAQRHAAAQTSASAAIRRAESDVTRLSARLREMGDTRGITQLNQGLITLRATLAGGTQSSTQIRQATEAFAKSTVGARNAIAAYAEAQRKSSAEARMFAQEQRRAADAARSVERELRSVAGANAAVSRSFREATGGMRGLENAFSSTFQAASMFRTMIGSITLGSFTSSVYNAGSAMEQFRVTMEVASGSARGAIDELDYIDGVASRLGVDLLTARDNYSKFAVSASIAGVQAQTTRHIFESVSTAMAVLGRSTEDQNLAFLALEQMMSKGVVSSEELRRQLGERLPGAVNMMAQALGVTMDQLQDMLKAGEIASADALPRFADVLMDRFGPGMEQATRRAGNNLQRLRNEVQLFLETAAQSGFMQELAVQFRTLTNAMQSGRLDGAARALGEGLATAARIGGAAMQWLVENFDAVARAIKAIGIGLIARQILQMGNAVASAGAQMAGYVQSWMQGNRGMDAAALATARHTAALQANTAALTANSTAQKASATALTTTGRAQEIAVRRAMTARTSTVAYTAAVATMGRAATAATGGMMFLSRALSVISPVVGIALTALLLIPGAMEAVGLGATEMEDRLSSAIARSGAAFDDLGTAIAESSARQQMNALIEDLEIFSRAVELSGQQAAGGFAAWMLEVDAMDALTLAVGLASGEMDRFQQLAARTALSGSFIDASAVEAMTGGSREAFQELYQTMLKVGEGQAYATDMQEQLNAAIERSPSDAPVFRAYEQVLPQLLQAQRGAINTTQRLTELFGTSTEQGALELARLAESVLRGTATIERFRERGVELSAENTALAGTFEQVGAALGQALRDGASPTAFAQGIMRVYSDSATAIVALRQEAARTADAVQQSVRNMSEQAAQSVQSVTAAVVTDYAALQIVPDDGEIEKMIADYLAVIQEFMDSQSGEDLMVDPRGLQNYFAALGEQTPQVQAFTSAMMEQFTALTSAEQTYNRLDTIMRQLGATSGLSEAELSSLTAGIRNTARAGNEGAVSVSDLEDNLKAIDWPEGEASATALAIARMGEETQGAGNSAATASGQLDSATASVGSIGGAAAAAASQVRALQAALASLGAIASGVPGAARVAIRGIRQETELQGLAPARRAGQRFFNEIYNDTEDQMYETAGQITAMASRGLGGMVGAMQAALTAQQNAAANLAAAREWQARIDQESQIQADTPTWESLNPTSRGGGGGGGGGRTAQLSDEQKALQDLAESLRDRNNQLMDERAALALVAAGQFENVEAAEMMAEAFRLSGGVVDQQTLAMIRQIDAAQSLNDALSTLANDPVREWMDSVPNWIEAGQQIEMGVIDGLKGAIKDLITTGEFDIEKLGETILGVIADVVADKAVEELMSLLGRGDPNSTGLGGVLGRLFGGDSERQALDMMEGGGEGQALVTGSQQAGQNIQTAMVQGGEQVASTIRNALQMGGQQVQASAQSGLTTGAAQVRAAGQSGVTAGAMQVRSAGMQGGQQMQQGVVAGSQQGAQILASGVASGAGGGGGMGGLGGIFSMLLGGLFSEGGYSTSAVSHAPVAASAFRGAPHYAQGTPNTSGIPAILHPNEAVIPLSRGRKIPVDLGDERESGGGGAPIINQTFNIQTPDADSFRRSKKEVAAEMAASGQRALRQNR